MTRLGLRLKGQLPLRLLQQRAEERGQGHRLGEQMLDRRGIGVGREDRVERGPIRAIRPRAARDGMATPSTTSVLS